MLATTGAVTLALVSILQLTEATRIPLTKRDVGIKQADGSINLAKLKEETSNLFGKYRRNKQATTNNARKIQGGGAVQELSKRGSIPLTIQDYAIWTGRLTIGTPPQPFDIYFDTGSSDFTVASTTCGTSCGSKDRYNPAASTTANTTTTTITTNFVDGTSSSGKLVYDTVTAGGLTAKSQAVISATSLSSSVSAIASDGLMGLAYPALSQAFSSSLQFTLTNEGQGNVPYFGLRLSNTPGVSAITFSGYNRLKVAGSIRWFNVVKDDSTVSFNTYWQVGGSAPFVNGVQASNRVNHIFDSGTTLIIAPQDAATAFWSKVPNSQVYDDGIWSFPCDATPTVEFSFARITLQKYGVDPEDFNLGYTPEDSSRCVGAVLGGNLGIGSSWILGDAFLLSHYIIHDVSKSRIGLAPPR